MICQLKQRLITAGKHELSKIFREFLSNAQQEYRDLKERGIDPGF